MPIRRKVFPCGHSGRGRECHVCAEEARRRIELEEAKRRITIEKAAWRESLMKGPKGIDRIPAEEQKETLRLVQLIERGEPWHLLGGKRLKEAGYREIISIPVCYSYRLVCRETGGAVRPVEVMSHSDYSSRISSGGWPVYRGGTAWADGSNRRPGMGWSRL